MRKPSNNPITLPFGSTEPPYSAASPHRGTDFSYIPDDTIYAPFSGKVTQVPNNGNDGNGTYMTDSQGRYHGLLHASKYLVPNGSNVQEGQAVAVMGDTGYAQGVHLHWAVKQNGQFIDPMSLIKQEEEMPLNSGDVTNMYNGVLFRGATDDEVKAWTGKQPSDLFYTLYNSQECKNLHFNSTVNDGDLANFFPTFTGHSPTKDDKEVWNNKTWKDFSYNKLLPEAKNRIKQ